MRVSIFYSVTRTLSSVQTRLRSTCMGAANDQDAVDAQRGMSEAVQEKLVARLAAISDLAMPASMTRAMEDATSSAQVAAYLASLLRRDPAVFLERYGRLLSAEELAAFEPLRDDYEVDHWLRHCTASTSAPAPAAAAAEAAEATAAVAAAAGAASGARAAGRLSTLAKNRRLAHMQGLQQQGQYFSEEAMRARAPLVWFEHVGQYEGAATPSAAGAAPPSSGGGASLSGSLLAAHDELQVAQRLQREREAQDAQFSEQEEESSEEEQQGVEEEAEGGSQHGEQGPNADAEEHVQRNHAVSRHTSTAGAGDQAERQQRGRQQQDPTLRRAHLQSEMEARFLLGLDGEHVDYTDIDGNEALDAHWAAQESRDREEAWFDAD